MNKNEKLAEDEILRLRELEMFERTHEKLISWAQKRFWWVIVLGGLTIGTSGFGLIQSMLSGANRAAIEAEINANSAKAATKTVKSQLDKAVEATNNATKQAEKAATLSEELQKKLNQIDKLSIAAEKRINSAINITKTIEGQLESLNENKDQLIKAQSDLHLRLKSFKENVENDLIALESNLRQIKVVADPENKSGKNLLSKFTNGDLPYPDRIKALNASAQSDGDSSDLIKILKEQIQEIGHVELNSEKDNYLGALFNALAQIQGMGSVEYFLSFVVDKKNSFEVRTAAGTALSSIRAKWSTYGVKLLQENFFLVRAASQDDMLQPFLSFNVKYLDEDAKKASLKLILEAIQNSDDNVVQIAAYAIGRNYASYRAALKPLQDRRAEASNKNLRKAIDGAIKTIKQYQKS